MLGTNFWRYVITQRNRRKSSADSGVGISVIAWIFLGSAFSPLSVNKCPMYRTSVAQNLHLSLFSFRFLSLAFCNTFSRRSSCCFRSSPHTRMSSMITSTPAVPSNSSVVTL